MFFVVKRKQINVPIKLCKVKSVLLQTVWFILSLTLLFRRVFGEAHKTEVLLPTFCTYNMAKNVESAKKKQKKTQHFSPFLNIFLKMALGRNFSKIYQGLWHQNSLLGWTLKNMKHCSKMFWWCDGKCWNRKMSDCRFRSLSSQGNTVGKAQKWATIQRLDYNSKLKHWGLFLSQRPWGGGWGVKVCKMRSIV